MATSTIERIEKHIAKIKKGKGKIRPGQPHRIPESWGVGDSDAQGDFIITVEDAVPKGYTLTANPDRQLVPGTTQGARHCLDSLEGVTVYLPPTWGHEGNLDGPCLVLTEERTVLHPTHGAITIPAGFTCTTSYQREYDQELKRERRNAD